MNSVRRFVVGCIAFTCASVVFSGCASSQRHVLSADESQVKIRAMQTRAFDTTDKQGTLRTVMATLQDLGFVVEQADPVIGTVSGTKLDGYALRMTVTVRERNASQLAVRASAQYNLKAIEDPEPYQQFFVSLQKAMFLTAQQVD